MTTLEEALDKLAKSRQALHQAIDGLSQEEMTQTQVEGVWTVKDILGHISSWEETCLEPFRHYAEGGPFQVEVIKDFTAWNDEQAARKQDVSLAAILDELTAIRQALVGAARELSAERGAQVLLLPWGEEGTVAEALDGLSQHEMEHVEAIQAWRRD